MIERHRFRPSARLRILGWMLGLTVLAVAGSLVLSWRLLMRNLDADVNRQLELEAEEFRSLAGGRDPATGEPFGGNVEAIFDTFLRRNVPRDGEAFYCFANGAFFRATAAPVALGNDTDAGSHWAGLNSADRGELSTDAGSVRWLAVPLQDGEGRTLGVFVVANFLQGERDKIADVMTTGLVVASLILVVAARVGWVLAGRILRPIRDMTNTARSITETDLSRRIEVTRNDEIADLAHTFNAMIDRLEAAFASQQAFVGDAGHELRTPITIVRGHLELLGDDPDDRRETVALVTDELDRMNRIVDDLLLLAKLEHPDFLRPEPIDVESFTNELFAKAQMLDDRQWQLTTSGTGTLIADPQRLTQAVMNLACNAAEHTGPDSAVTLGSTASDGEAAFWVADTGPGIEPAEQTAIFERFARGGAGRRRSQGAGLGLAIVQAVAVAHAGRVSLDSRPGAGARFTITLPTHPPQATT